MQLFLQFVCFIAVILLHLNFFPVIGKDNFIGKVLLLKLY